MPALAVPEQTQPDTDGRKSADSSPAMKAANSDGASAVHEQTEEAQPTNFMHWGSFARKAAVALEASEHPQDERPADSSNCPQHESRQAHAGSQVNGQHPLAEQKTKEHSPDELHPGTAGMDEHANGIASVQNSGSQELQEAKAASPAEDEQSPKISMIEQLGRANSAEVENGEPDGHGHESDKQAAESARGSDKTGNVTALSAAEREPCWADADTQIGNADSPSGDGLQSLQQAEGVATASGHSNTITTAAESFLAVPDSTQVAEQQRPPRDPAHATPSKEGLAMTAPTHGEPEHMNVSEDTNVIEEVSDEESSEDEHVAYHDLPNLIPECFSDPEDGDSGAEDEVFTFPAGMTELELRGGLHPVRIPLPSTAGFRYSVQDEFDDDQPLQGKEATADVPAAAQPPYSSVVDHVQPERDRASQAAAVPDKDGDGQIGHEEPQKPHSMAQIKDSPEEAPLLARCALRPGVAREDQCDKSANAFAIREGQRYLKVTCTEGCTITYHFTCWRRLERVYRAEHPEFSWKSKEGVQCFTDGCTGQVKLAQELEEEAGIDTHRRELLRLPDQAKKPERPPPAQEQLEQRRGRKKGPVQRAPELEPVVQQERVADRPAAVPANTNVDDKQEPLPKPDRVPALGPFLLPRQDDDDEDLERLAAGLKGKKEKKKREKKKEKEVIQIGGPDQDTQLSFFEELERERRATPTLDTATFPRMVSADDGPDLAIGEDPLWDLLISMKSFTPAEHLLIWHIDTQSLARRGVSASDELHRLLCSHGRIASLEVYLHLSAAAVSFLRTQDAQKALFKVDGHQLERKKLQGCFLRAFPGDQDVLTQKLQDSLPQRPPAASASAAPPTDQAAEMKALMARECQNLPTIDHSVSGKSAAASEISLAALSQGGAPAEQPIQQSRAGSWSSGTRSPTRQDKVEMLSVQLGAEYLSLQPRAVPYVPSLPRRAPALPRPQANLNPAAHKFCPGVLLQGAAVQGADFGAGLASAASQSSLSSADGTAASWPMQPSQLDAAGRATSMRSNASSISRADPAACEPPPPPPFQPVQHTLPGLDQVSVMQIAGCTSKTLATFRLFEADGGFAIPTTDLGQVNPLLDANCTGLLLYENESQMLHGLWKSTRIAESGTERVMEFEAHTDMDPLRGRLLQGVLQTHSTGDLRLPQAARGARLEALKPLLRPEGSSEPPTPDPGAVKLALGLKPDSKPFSPLATSGGSTPSTAAAAAASAQRPTTATITEVAQRITPRSRSKAAQQTLPSDNILRQAVTGTVLSSQAWEASTDKDANSGIGTAGGSTGIGESTESQVQRQLGFTVHAEGLRASVTPFAKGSTDKPPDKSSRIESEPQSGGEALKPSQGGDMPEILKRPSPELLVLPAMDAGGPSPELSIGREPLSGKVTPEVETGSTVSFTAQPSPVCAPSSSGQAPVHASQSPQPVQQSVAAPPAQTGSLTAGQQGPLSPPAGTAQQAGSAPQAASPGRAQPHAQLPVPVGFSIQQHPPGALPGPVKQPADSSAPTVPAPAVPVRRMLLPRVPRPAAPSITTSQPGSSGNDQLSSVLSFLLPKEAPKAAAAASERPPAQGPQPARPQPALHKAPESPAGESAESAAAQPQLLDALTASGSGKGLPAPAPSPSRPQPAAKGEERSKQLSAGASEGASGSEAKSGSPQVLRLEALIAAKPKVTREVARAGRSASPSNSQVSRESASPVRSSADMSLGSGASTADVPAAAVQAAKGKKKRKQYAPLAVPVAAQPATHAPRSAPMGPWASGPPAALVTGDSSRAQSGSEASPVPPLTPAAIATALHVSQPQGPWAAGEPIAGGPADRSQRPQPTQVTAPAAAAEPSAVPRTQPKPEYRPPDVSPPSETLPWVFSSSHAGLGASQSGSSSGTQPAPKPRAPAPGTASGAQAAAASEPAAAVGLAAAAAPARAASVGRRARMCPLCRTERAGHIVTTCKHFGPCGTCVPSADRLDLYPECLQCGGKVAALFRFFW